MNDEFMKTLISGIRVMSIEADMIDLEFERLERDMSKLDDDLDKAINK
ncbi:hypothetical protein [Pseudolactococcus paracarnosus]|nr:hypothetical protein [Lactococcus paracarnosus]